MSINIDSLQLEIQTNSSNAAGGIDSLAQSLERLKKVGSFNVVVKNLNNLSSALDKLRSTSSGLGKLNSLASTIELLKKAGSFGSVGNSFAKLGTALKDLESINIDGIVAKIKELNDKIGPVSQKLVSVGNAFKTVNSKAIQTSGGFSIFGGKVNTTTLNLSHFINVAKNVISSLQRIIQLFEKTIGDAIEWEGIAQRFGRGFGDQADDVYSWIQELNKEMGINTQQFMQYSSTYATMLKGFGVASEDASKMALGYMELTYDVWAGYNDIYKSLDDAATAVRSAIAGEVEPVRKAGFTIIESTLEQTAANHGLKISLEKATEAQKSYLRYLTLVDQAKAQNLVGNYAREMNTAEGVMRTFNQQLKSLGQTFGSVFLPVLVKVMPWLQAFVELLGDAIIAIAAFFNVDIQKVDFGSDISYSADSATESVNGTTAALKELKNATTGIDELNIISPQSASGGSGSGGTSGSLNGLDVNSLWDKSIFDTLQSDVDEVKEKLKDWMPTLTAITAIFVSWRLLNLINDVKTLATSLGVGSALGGAFKWIKEFFAAAKTAAPEVGWLAALFPKIAAALKGFSFKGLLSAIGKFASKFGWVGAIIAGVIAAITYAIDHWGEVVRIFNSFVEKEIAPKIEAIKGYFKEMGEAITSSIPPEWLEWIKGAIAWLGDAIAWLWEAFGGSVFHTTMAGVMGIISGIINAVKGVVRFITGVVQVVVGVVETIVKTVIAIFNGNWEDVLEPLNKIWEGIKNIFGGLYDIVIGPIYEFIKGVIQWFVELWDELVGHSIVPDTIDGIINCFKELPGKILGVVSTFVSNVIGKFSDFGSRLVSKIKEGWETVKKWWSNNVKLSIPSLSLKVTYTTTGLGTIKKAIVNALGLEGWPKISFAANGGIFDTGSLVWAGEAGPEIVANAGGGKTGVMNVQQMSDAVYQGVYSAVIAAMRASNGSGGGQSVNVYLDGKQITSSVEQRQKERGASLMGSQVYAY